MRDLDKHEFERYQTLADSGATEFVIVRGRTGKNIIMYRGNEVDVKFFGPIRGKQARREHRISRQVVDRRIRS